MDAFQNKILNAKWAVENITDERFNLDVLIQQFKNLNPDLSFVGIAVHKEEERYLIQHFAGQSMDRVLGIEVALGEGF